MGSSSSQTGSSRHRLRWTEDLHDRFVDAITQLGGPDKISPRKYLPKPGAEGPKIEKKSASDGDDSSDKDPCSGLQIDEALRMQMEVQKRLLEQHEVQRQLQLRIEAQGKYLQKIIEEQQKISGVLIASGFDQGEKRQDL